MQTITNYKETEDLSNYKITNQTDFYILFLATITEYTYFSSANGTVSRINYILGHKISFNKFGIIKIIQCMFSKPNGNRNH